MKILFDIPRYLPWRDGAILMVQDYRNAMISRGHEVKIWCLDGRRSGNIDDLYKWADVIISHLGRSMPAMEKAKEMGKPFVWLAHSDQFRIPAPTISNSFWLAKYFNKIRTADEPKSVVCYPICNYDKFQEQSEGSYITLIGLNKNKGGFLLRELAERMTGHRFIGVAGAYGGQEMNQPKNVKVIPHPCFIDKVLKDTKILLVMSEHESFSRCVAEAMSMGIPVISTRTKGVQECANEAAIYVDDREDISEWIDKITMAWQAMEKYQKLSLARSRVLQESNDSFINQFENYLYESKSVKTVPVTV